MNWLTEFIALLPCGADLLNAALLVLSTLPLVGTAVAGETGEDAQVDDLEFDDGPTGEEPTPTPTPAPQPFLRASEQTVYMTPDDAIKGIQTKDELISKYSKLGKPEELSARLEQLDRFSKLQQFLDGGGDKGAPKPPELFADMSPEDQKKFLEFHQKYSPALKQAFTTKEDLEKAGYIRAEDLPRHFEILEKRRAATGFLGEAIVKRGFEDTPQTRNRVERAIFSLEHGDPEAFQKVSDLYERGDVQGAINLGMETLFGKAPVPAAATTPAPAPAPVRDPNGRFTRQELAAAKRKTENLPKAPPQSTATLTDAGKSNPSTRESRRSAMERILDERTAARSV